jgi:hypothetical protein
MTKSSKTARPTMPEDAMTMMAREAHERVQRDNSDPSRSQRRGEGVLDRRTGLDRRDFAKFQAGRAAGEDADEAPAHSSQSSASTNLERRRGPGRRRTDFMKCADEGEMTAEQFLFIMAIDAFKRVNGKTFPTWTDVLEVIRKLGYRKTMPSELNLGRNAEDWTEAANAPAGVFKEAEED